MYIQFQFGDPLMSATKHRRSGRRSQVVHLGKPHGILAPRVQTVGPEHFGILAVDPAKHRSYVMLADFYGRILIPVTVVEHTQCGFDKAIAELRQAITTHDLRDLVVAIEQTGTYHRPIQRAYADAGFQARIVHPSISRHFREAGAYDNKTDPTDLEGIFRSAVNGFGLQQPTWDPVYTGLQLLARHRRDLVQKSSLLRCQLLEHLELCLPGYVRCFDDVFRTKIALIIPRRYPTPEAVAQAGLAGLTQLARLARVQVQTRTLLRIVGWAQNAPTPDRDAVLHQRLFGDLNDDRITKVKQVQSIERELVDHLVQTPYVRLLALPGINVVLASEFAGEAGPMVHYATPRVITGRAGMYPRRYQSDQVDLTSGRLARRGNRRLRQALLLAADTLIRCNDHFGVLAAKWRGQGKDPRDVHVRVAGRFARIAFQMVTGTEGFDHPACQEPSYVIEKLNTFHEVHIINEETTKTNLQRAAAQLPSAKLRRNHPSLDAQRKAARGGQRCVPKPPQRAASKAQPTPGRGSRERSPKPLNEVLPAALKNLVGGDAAKQIESTMSGETP
jgi:transposase